MEIALDIGMPKEISENTVINLLFFKCANYVRHTFKNVLYEYYKDNTLPYILVPVIYCELTVKRCCIYRYRGPVIYYELTVRRCCI